jgi:hypothetical protein
VLAIVYGAVLAPGDAGLYQVQPAEATDVLEKALGKAQLHPPEPV